MTEYDPSRPPTPEEIEEIRNDPGLLAAIDQAKAEVRHHAQQALDHWLHDTCEFNRDECIGGPLFMTVLQYTNTPAGSRHLATLYMEAISRLAEQEEDMGKHSDPSGARGNPDQGTGRHVDTDRQPGREPTRPDREIWPDNTRRPDDPDRLR